MEITAKRLISLERSIITELIEAPMALSIPISFTGCSEVNQAGPSRPRQAMNRERIAKIEKIRPVRIQPVRETAGLFIAEGVGWI